MAANESNDDPFRELDSRVIDGVHVVLFWEEGTTNLSVCVFDERSGSYFELAAAPDDALDVFRHPFSYAAFRGMSYQAELGPSRADAVTAGEPVLADISSDPSA